MGNQSLVVIVQFVFLHIGALLCIVSIATPVWIESDSTTTHNVTEDAEWFSKGLWEICDDYACWRFDQSQQSSTFTATQVFFSFGSVLTIIFTLTMYVILGYYELRKSERLAWLRVFGITVANVCLAISLLLYGVLARKQNLDIAEDIDVKLGWSFYIGIGACFFVFISLIAAARRYQILKVREKGFRELTASMAV